MSTLTVIMAIYGAMADGGNENASQAANVTAALQEAINSTDGIVAINNETLGIDPSSGNEKHFAAQVAMGSDSNRYFACKEGQTIDFYHLLPPQGALAIEGAGQSA